ncbi:EboA domain-containing protein [Flavobacteriaceae bacterium 3-367]|uniref:EboA domain-containing protein n=1 Tax=Eudoraea algarum TaxID=3417568 RepID=UPI00326B9D9D
MRLENVRTQLATIVESGLDNDTKIWFRDKIEKIIEEESARELYLTYSLIASKVDRSTALALDNSDSDLLEYLKVQRGNMQQVARIYLLAEVLGHNEAFFAPKVANIIQVADTEELIALLKFLVLLPNAQNYKSTAVEALRTNIATVFNAIALKNPYPALYFNDQEWNQMYLKAAFMQQNLQDIVAIDKRANSELARIISDYAHERWAASRDIDPYFWRPVGAFLNEVLLQDMERLLKSHNPVENMAGVLCCSDSDKPEAKVLIKRYPHLVTRIRDKQLTWETLKN